MGVLAFILFKRHTNLEKKIVKAVENTQSRKILKNEMVTNPKNTIWGVLSLVFLSNQINPRVIWD